MTTTIDTTTPVPGWVDTIAEWERVMLVDGGHEDRSVSRTIGAVSLNAWQQRHADGSITMDGLQAHVEYTMDQDSGDNVAAELRKLAADAQAAADLLDPPLPPSGKTFLDMPPELLQRFRAVMREVVEDLKS